MPHDPVRIAETLAWLKKAAEDRRLGELALGADPPVLGGAVFHAQQAAEKALKAFLDSLVITSDSRKSATRLISTRTSGSSPCACTRASRECVARFLPWPSYGGIFLDWHNRSFRRTHDLAELGQSCARIDPTLDPLWKKADKLTAYAWVFRYPGEEEEPTREETEEALSLAREVYDAVVARMPEEVRP